MTAFVLSIYLEDSLHKSEGSHSWWAFKVYWNPRREQVKHHFVSQHFSWTQQGLKQLKIRWKTKLVELTWIGRSIINEVTSKNARSKSMKKCLGTTKRRRSWKNQTKYIVRKLLNFRTLIIFMIILVEYSVTAITWC